MSDKKRRKVENKIFKRIAAYGGATVFWITQSQALARAMDELEAAGRVVRLMDHPQDRYPFCVYGIRTKNLQTIGENRTLSTQRWRNEYLGKFT